MKDNRNIVIGVVVLVVLILGIVFPRGNSVVERVINNTVGAVSTLDGVDTPFVKIGGNQRWIGSLGISATSSVLCSLKNPFGATSTLESFSYRIATSSIARSEYVSLSTSTSQYRDNAGSYGSSTNAFMHTTIPAYGYNDAFSFRPNSATSTGTGASATGDASLYFGITASGTSAYIIKPTEYLNLVIGSTTPGTFATFPQGTCSYEIQKN